MKTYRDLMVWQKAMSMVTEVYKMTKNFPPNEIYGLTSQIRRSAISIPSNIAEGSGRNSNLEHQRFLKIAMGSIYEMQTQIEIAFNIGYLKENEFQSLSSYAFELEKMLSSFLSKIKQAKN